MKGVVVGFNLVLFFVPFLPSLKSADQDSHASLYGVGDYSQAYAQEQIPSTASFGMFVTLKVD